MGSKDRAKMTLAERLRSLRGDTSTADFCRRFGIHRNTLPRYESGERTPDADFLEAICRAYNVNPSWLLLGEGPMTGGVTTLQPKGDESSFDLIPMVETELSAGGGAFVQSEDVKGHYAFRKEWIRKVASGPKDMVLMRVFGNSMYPTIQDGDTVMIDTNRKKIVEGGLFALRFDQTVMIKRLSFRTGGKIQIISDNREYQPYEADMQDIHIIGQVIFFSRVLIQE
ncbi:MAG: helix-turn-helix transcriptional regulator [Desulfobulbaceae bacterium]|nr:MAG: helix-turn-helix transcriptional regulator [Desulfobulbaceae bacterium]